MNKSILCWVYSVVAMQEVWSSDGAISILCGTGSCLGFPNKCERAQVHGLKSVLQSWYFKYRNELLYLRRSKVLA